MDDGVGGEALPASVAFAAAVAAAPTCPGVYVFLGGAGELLYVGKAGDLRRRLRDHAKAEQVEEWTHRRYAGVREIRWEPLANEAAALAREADLIVALRPPLNKAGVFVGRWTYVQVERSGGSVTIDLVGSSDDAAPVRGGRLVRVYGGFPHLGPGLGSLPGIQCTEGFASVLRLLWAAGPGGAFPSRLGGPNPRGSCVVELDERWDGPLHQLLSGQSASIVRLLADVVGTAAGVEPYQRPALVRDLDGARAFFRYGPQALRALRLRHGVRSRLLSRSSFDGFVAAELRAAVGDFVIPPDPPGFVPGVTSRRTRSGWSP